MLTLKTHRANFMICVLHLPPGFILNHTNISHLYFEQKISNKSKQKNDTRYFITLHNQSIFHNFKASFKNIKRLLSLKYFSK